MWNETTGWHGCERVIVQARCDGWLLVQYPTRCRIGARTLIDSETGITTRRGAVVPWAWVPETEIDLDSDWMDAAG